MATPLDPELVAQIRESLFAGRGVRLVADSPPVAKLDVLTPMTVEGEAFFEGKLEKIAELLDRGFVVNIDSDGSILAQTPDSRSRYISTQESDIDVMDRIMVKTALEQGASVGFEADGSLVINAAVTPTTVPAATAAAQFAEFERIADSGQIGVELAAGRDFEFEAAAVPTTTPVPAPLDDPFDTAAELQAEADSLQLGADAARAVMLPEYVAEKSEAESQRTFAERQLAMTAAEVASADQQASTAQAQALDFREKAQDQRGEAISFRAQGQEREALEAEANADNLLSVATMHDRTAEEATQAGRSAKVRLGEETEALADATAGSEAVNDKYRAQDGVYGEQTDEAMDARSAAAELAEAERLEQALPDLEARGVAGLERVRAAIVEHRAAAETFIEQGNLRATTGIVVTGGDADVVVDPDDPDLDVSGPDPTDLDLDVSGPDPTDHDVLDPEPIDPYPFDPDGTQPGDASDVSFAMIDPDAYPTELPPALTVPDSSEPAQKDSDDSSNLITPQHATGPDSFDPKPIDPRSFDFGVHEPEPQVEIEVVVDDDGVQPSADDFAETVADIDEMVDDLDEIGDF